jgi:cyclophilin family peptidyl-prolyl cis-trans isomerase
MNKQVIAIVVVVCILLGAAIYFFGPANKGKPVVQQAEIVTPDLRPTQKSMSIQKPSLQIDTKKTYVAVVQTSQGDITVSLDASKTPIIVNNFVYLVRQHFYDNTIFHRVISGFMIQGGDPRGDGTGGPGYQFDDEAFDGSYSRGTVAMANAGPNTNGSQFFIMHKDYDLPKNYVIFGHVTKGLEIVDKIATAPVTTKNGENSSPVIPVKVQSVVIIEQ